MCPICKAPEGLQVLSGGRGSKLVEGALRGRKVGFEGQVDVALGVETRGAEDAESGLLDVLEEGDRRAPPALWRRSSCSWRGRRRQLRVELT
ncbi:hypothetical protein CRG98_015972 [Punica granatum]|uniref:Uncharacterized protein n=1 Tax=Punica granatum TaxID=22663 RepID=A0A2I0K518_PUNGR|nr:hypothetical protein CRG98_015972 [Punica granatum]